MIEPLLLTAARVTTFDRNQKLTNASRFFYDSEDRRGLVTSRHVLADRPSRHFPPRLEIERHVDPDDVTRPGYLSTRHYEPKRGVLREGADTTGPVDLTALAIDRAAFPPNVAYRAFDPHQIAYAYDRFEAGTELVVSHYTH